MNAQPNMCDCHIFCRGCGYALIGLPSNRCPECGREFDPDNPRTFLARPRRMILRRIIRAFLVLLVCITLFAGSYVGYLDWQVRQEATASQILRANGARILTYDTTPPWARKILPRHIAWLWRRAELVGIYGDTKNLPQCMAIMAHLKSLQELYLVGLGNTLTTNDMAQLKELTALQRFMVCGTDMTDPEVAQLKDLTSLQYLDLHGTHVSDAGLAQLKELTALKTLDLCGTKVTDPGVADLQKALPKCKIDGPS